MLLFYLPMTILEAVANSRLSPALSEMELPRRAKGPPTIIIME